ncbi:MAG: hypothetical protein NUV82_03895 [Candidatus Komeilibacteria bacterium]|nr:hypothetical protein [Candidatus Komeilibacteria bacterium]
MEIIHFDWNSLTFSFLVTLAFSIAGTFGLWDQTKKILLHKSGRSVANIVFISGFFLYIASGIYGFQIQSMALELSSVIRGPWHIPIVIGLFKYKGFTKWEKNTCYILAGLCILLFLTQWDLLFLLVTGVVVLPAALQPYGMWKEKKRGVVSVGLFSIYAISAAFWTVYALAIDNYIIFTFSLISSLIFGLTVLLYFIYKN